MSPDTSKQNKSVETDNGDAQESNSESITRSAAPPFTYIRVPKQATPPHNQVPPTSNHSTMKNRALLKSTIIAIGCYAILTLVLPADEGSDISPTAVTVDTRGWFEPDVTISMHRVEGSALKNRGSDAGIDEALQVNGSDLGLLARQPLLQVGSPFSAPVSGLIADGVTPLLFRVSAGGGLTEQVTYDLKLEVSQLRASCPDLSGRIKVLEGGIFREGSKVTLSPQRPEAYVILGPVAAKEILPKATTEPEDYSGMAEVELSLKRQNATWLTRKAAKISFGVRKPPVVLVHGYDSDSSTWKLPFLLPMQADRGRPFVVAVNYGTNNGNFENTYGGLPTLTETLSQALAQQVETRDGTALWPSDKWAWTRYDAVGHSQGGVLLRLLCSSSLYPNDKINHLSLLPFRNLDNNERGRFHRVITIGSPHFGSTMAHLGNLMLAPPEIAFGSNLVGWLGDAERLLRPKFRIDLGNGVVHTAQELNNVFIPDPESRIHMLGATIDHGQVPGPRPGWFETLPRIFKAVHLEKGDDTRMISGNQWGTWIAPYGSDSVVDLRSQLADLTPNSLQSNATRMDATKNIAHADAWRKIACDTDRAETNDQEVAEKVITILSGDLSKFAPFPSKEECAPLHTKMNATAAAIEIIIEQLRCLQLEAQGTCHSVASSPPPTSDPAPRLPRRGPRSPSDTPQTVNMILQPPLGESPIGPVTWIVVVYGPNGVTTEGVTLKPTGTYGENLQIDLAASVIGEVVVSVQYPSTTGITIIGKPGVVASRSTGTLTGIEIRPDTVALSAGPTVPLEIWGVYDPPSKVLLFTDTDNTVFASGNEAVATVNVEGRVTLVAPGTTTLQATYNGSHSAAATIHVLAPAPVITSPLAVAGDVGQAFSYQIAADGSPVEFSAEGLPVGLTVNPATGLVSGSPSFEGLFHFSVGASNSDGQEGVRQVKLAVTGPNRAPTAIGLDTNSVPAMQAPGTAVGHLATVDANLLDTFTYQLVGGAGDSDNSLFSISEGILLTTTSVDPSTKPRCMIRLRSTDSGGQSVEQELVLPVLGGPAIVTAPTDTIAFSGRPFVLEVEASGREPLAFLWQENGVDIPGATSKTLERVAGMPGSLGFTVRVSNALGEVTSLPAAVTVSPLSFGAWAAPYTLPDTGTISPEGDLNHDGYSNLLEFAFNTNPLQANSGGRPVANLLHEVGGDLLSLTHRRIIGGTLEFKYEWSADLSLWTPFIPRVEVVAPDADGDGGTELIRASRPIGFGEPAGFLRLKVREP